MDNTSQIVWGLLFGAIGLGFFMYGKKQRSPIPLVAGLGLMVVPYFIPNVFLLVIVGAALMALPYFIQL